MTREDPDFVHKLVFLGDTEVGKTSLVQRYVYDSFSPEIGRTIGAMLHVKTVELNGVRHKLVVWDLGGQESFTELREQYCSHASGAFFVFDRTRVDTLEHIDDWLNALYSAAGKVAVVVVENKIDLESVISDEQIHEAIETRSLKLIQTSATENKNVDTAFEELVKEISVANPEN
ncbi:MAG: GTP-binding protein [Candidatus Thorarchaeota archaeon]|nr:MAG: GTP-binding protein [Candidatus Thorarchaeota archaeon]